MVLLLMAYPVLAGPAPHSPAQLGVSPSRPRRPGCTPRAASGRPCGVTRERLNATAVVERGGGETEPVRRGSRCGGVGVELITSCDERRCGLLLLLARVGVTIGYDHPNAGQHRQDKHRLIK